MMHMQLRADDERARDSAAVPSPGGGVFGNAASRVALASVVLCVYQISVRRDYLYPGATRRGVLLPRVARIRIAAYAGPLARLPLSAPDMPFRWGEAPRHLLQ
jgi:hypothetical protein